MDERLTRTLAEARAREVCGPRPHLLRLRVRTADAPGATYDLQGPRLVIGAHPQADLVLPGPAVSGVHCALEVEREGSVRLRDLNSKNGVWIGEMRVFDVGLAVGTEFSVGQARLRLDDVRDVPVPISTENRFGDFFGSGADMGELIAFLKRLANTDLSVLISGESGTGKELIARALHHQSGRAQGPFVVMDCGGVARGVIESELFGHAKGAFTGAHEAKPGRFEQADGGTIFLDEICELPLDLQPKLLRALEARETCRVGETHFRRFDVRVVAATNRDLRRATNDGEFREDLFFRLAQAPVTVPPLRERQAGNVELLAELFVERMAANSGRRLRLTRAALAALARAPWRGNVRELRNVVVRAAALSDGPEIDACDLLLLPTHAQRRPAEPAELAWARGPWSDVKREFETRYMLQLLADCEGNRAEATRRSGLSSSSFHAFLKRTGIR